MSRHPEFEDLSEDEMEKWLDKATDRLIELARLPLSDDVWATDRYSDVIFVAAKDMYDDFVYGKKD